MGGGGPGDRHAGLPRRRAGNNCAVTTLTDIARLAADGESETVEFKATTGQRTEAARTLSAMLNGKGGRVLFGVRSGGNVVGQQVSDKTMQDITNACSEIRPAHPPSIERFAAPRNNRLEILVVSVPAGAAKPYSHKGRYYVRSGTTTVDMPDEVQVSMVLERAHSQSRWELEDSGGDLATVDSDEVRNFRDDAIASSRAGFNPDAPARDVLRALNLLDSLERPNRGAIALFGRPEAFAGRFPSLGCRLVAVDGTDIGERLDDDVLAEENAFASMRRALAFCERHLSRSVRIEGGLQADVDSEIPRLALREALANAFGHRDYAMAGKVQVRIFSDRLEVWSPGGLRFGLTPADLYAPHSSHPWNPNIVGCLYRRGIVEQLGAGTTRMARVCVEAGLGRPVFVATSTTVTCVVPRRGHWLAPDGTNLAVDRREAAILAELAVGPASRRRLAEASGASTTRTGERLAHLRDLGLVRVAGHGRGAQWHLRDTSPPPNRGVIEAE